MAATSSCSFSAVSYALAKLGTPELVLKPKQQQAISAVVEGNDVFVCLPTGFGKSICYQSLPFIFDHRLGMVAEGRRQSAVLVVSPLIALMVDQVQSLKSKDVQAVIIS